ncbi:MAG TPA: response regulator [Polyangiaceae bacterium]|nr:response regulator [Polyangiaceae bacterium]
MDTVRPTYASPLLRVLLIEDSPNHAQLVGLELLNQGYEATITRVDNMHGLSRALHEGPWDVVLCEHRLRALDAMSALTMVQASGFDLPFIIVASSISESSAIEAMRAGAHDFVYKDALGKLGAIIERETCEAELRAERRRMQKQLVLADRLSSIGMLAAGVAHEINNPLAYVLGNLDFALARLADGQPLESGEASELLQALEQAREGSERIGRITHELKVFCGGRSEPTRGPVNVRRVMESSISIAWNHIRHRARLTRRFEHVPVVFGDEHRLGQVFLNLLVNAAQALPEEDVAQNEIVVAIRADGGKVFIEVQDTGSGMSPEDLSRAFEPFFTTKPRGTGSGIGLSICRSIVTDMGGKISCASRRGFGTTFFVELPAQEALVSATLPPPAELPELRTARVLVIDDEPALCAVVRRLLRGRHEVVGLGGGREALKLLEADAAFDVIICDVMMSQMSGVDFFEALGKNHPGLKPRVVFMTGGALHAPTQQFLRASSNPLLDKPFETRALHEAIARVLDAGAVSGTWLAADVSQAV